MTACFGTEQPSVRIVEQGKVYVFIALNGRWTNRQGENGEEPVSCWECDYTELVAQKGQIDTADVMAHPEKYLDWVPPVEKSPEEKIADLQEQNRVLTAEISKISETSVDTIAMIVDYIYEQDSQIFGGEDDDDDDQTGAVST